MWLTLLPSWPWQVFTSRLCADILTTAKLPVKLLIVRISQYSLFFGVSPRVHGHHNVTWPHNVNERHRHLSGVKQRAEYCYHLMRGDGSVNTIEIIPQHISESLLLCGVQCMRLSPQRIFGPSACPMRYMFVYTFGPTSESCQLKLFGVLTNTTLQKQNLKLIMPNAGITITSMLHNINPLYSWVMSL